MVDGSHPTEAQVREVRSPEAKFRRADTGDVEPADVALVLDEKFRVGDFTSCRSIADAVAAGTIALGGESVTCGDLYVRRCPTHRGTNIIYE